MKRLKGEEQMQRILHVLKEHKKVSKSKLAILSSLNHYVLEARLNDLEEQGKIIRVQENSFEYWRLK